tara:strand:- start:1556 stop:2014 length:459 start_codon:yes stop_codon:yes gene_type:complete
LTPESAKPPPLWLDDWRAEDAVPVPLERIQADADAAGLSLLPIGQRGAIVLANRYLRAWRLPQGLEWESASELYRDALADVPPDLLELAFQRAVRECKFFPTVAEIRGHANPELSRRKRAMNRLAVALSKVRHAAASEARRVGLPAIGCRHV